MKKFATKLPYLSAISLILIGAAIALNGAPGVHAGPGCALVDADGTIVLRCLSLDPETASGPVGGQLTLIATVTDDSIPVAEEEVVVRVASGPNAGRQAAGFSNLNGEFQLIYNDTGGAGTDMIDACLTDLLVSGYPCFNFGSPGQPAYIQDASVMTWGGSGDTPTPTTPPDADGDGVSDEADNCPNWPNANQAMPSWSVPAGDPDCDGFTTGIENFIGTDPFDPCSADTGANNESPDAWPTDNNDNRFTQLSDVQRYIQVFNSTPAPGSPYDSRYDLNASDSIGLTDIQRFLPYFNKPCTP